MTCTLAKRILLERETPQHLTARLFVDVIEQRAVARGIAEECGVAHESPQAILFRRGEPVWSAAHFEIKAETLAAAWNERSPD